MIQANEARRGNWVLFDNRHFKIDVISEEFPTLDTTEFGIGVVNWNNIQPIPLTEEILLKCGFVLGMRLEDFVKGKYRFVEIKGGITYGEFSESGVFYFNTKTKIQYLHQLQNLYFALTGQELEVNI